MPIGCDGICTTSTSPTSTSYNYDDADRLTAVQDTLDGAAGNTCTTRQYAFNDRSDRTSLASYPAAGDGSCTTSSTPTTTSYSYDDADRLTSDTAGSYSYDQLGRTTTVPAGDAAGIGSHASTTGDLTVSYYANDMVASQTQGAATVSFTLDPDQNRILSSTDGSATTVDHYSDDSDSPAWTETGSDWSRDITGIDGGLAATITQAGTVTLQLANPHGDVVATAADDPAATGIASYSETTEYGQPRDPASANDTYGWLGSKQRSTNDLAGLTLMGVRLYNPATGRFRSVDPIPGGDANAYTYPDDPINSFDCGGEASHYTKVIHLTTKKAKHWISRLETGASIGELIAPAIGYVPFVGEILDIADQIRGLFAEDLAERIRVMNSKRGVDIQIKLTYVG